MRRILSILVLLLGVGTVRPQEQPPSGAIRRGRSASGSKGVVVSGRAAPTDAGVKILGRGGNAADAGAATLLALSVTTVGAFCIGGEVPLLVYSAEKKHVKVLA